MLAIKNVFAAFCLLASCSAFAIAEDGWVDVKRDFGAVGDGATDDTKAVQDAMTYAERKTMPVRIPPGTYLVGPISLGDPSTQNRRSDSGQSPAVLRIQGAGRGPICKFKAKPGVYKEGEFVLTRRNPCGVHYSDFMVDGNKIAAGGIDLSFSYDGRDIIAPSSMNILENVWIEGCTDIGANLDGFHDSKVSGMIIRRISGREGIDPISISFRGGGGLMTLCDSIFASGVARMSAQNGEFARCGFFNGIEVTGAGYNHINFNGCHFYTNPKTEIMVNSTAKGNATCALLFTGCFFTQSGKNYIAGRFHAGAEFVNCQFHKIEGPFFGPIEAAEGGGKPPFFVFRFCSFRGDDPSKTTDPKTARVKTEFCHPPQGIYESGSNYGAQAKPSDSLQKPAE